MGSPQSDGVNLYRPVRGTYVLSFPVTQPTFAVVQLQVYASPAPLSSWARIDGQPVPLVLVENLPRLEMLLAPGLHTLQVTLRCSKNACHSAPRLYGTEVTLRSVRAAIEPGGIAVSRVNADSPGSPLKVRGASPVRSDGVNLYREVSGPEPILLQWPSRLLALKAEYQVFSASGALTVRAEVNDRVVASSQIPARTFTYQTVNLLNAGPAGQTGPLRITFSCQGKTSACFPARLYFTHVETLRGTVREHPLSPLQWAGLILLCLMMLAVLGLWLRLPVPGRFARR